MLGSAKVLSKEAVCREALHFARTVVPQLTVPSKRDGKTLGTFMERSFCKHLSVCGYTFQWGNAANGLDLPDLRIDIKTTSSRRPQSSCAFNGLHEAVYGLQYDLIVFVYKLLDQDPIPQRALPASGGSDSDEPPLLDDSGDQLRIESVLFIDCRNALDKRLNADLRRILDTPRNVSVGDAAWSVWLQTQVRECIFTRFRVDDEDLVTKIVNEGVPNLGECGEQTIIDCPIESSDMNVGPQARSASLSMCPALQWRLTYSW